MFPFNHKEYSKFLHRILISRLSRHFKEFEIWIFKRIWGHLSKRIPTELIAWIAHLTWVVSFKKSYLLQLEVIIYCLIIYILRKCYYLKKKIKKFYNLFLGKKNHIFNIFQFFFSISETPIMYILHVLCHIFLLILYYHSPFICIVFLSLLIWLLLLQYSHFYFSFISWAHQTLHFPLFANNLVSGHFYFFFEGFKWLQITYCL